jgi:glycosyltransferase involved in cell wall biosynthesis
MDIKSADPLLTIAIPTFNRAAWLDLCLSQLVKQAAPLGQQVEILVSNNNSTDNTEAIINKYVSSGTSITYIRNAENIGSDRNLLQCFKRSSGKYVLVMGDDDVILDGALGKIVSILEKGEYGVVFLNSYGFTNDFLAERPKARTKGHKVYANADAFINKASYLMAFISVNIVNKKFVDETILEQLLDTNLVHLGWIFSALFNSKKNVYVHEYSVAARMYNSGGYKLCDVFAVKLNKVFDFFVDRGVSRGKFDIINDKLLSKFLPAHIVRCKTNLLNLISEDYYHTLYPLYKTYLYFWIFTVPAIFLPLPVSKFFYSVAKAVRQYTPFR